MEKEHFSLKRILLSRKMWGALIGTIGIILAGKFLPDVSVTTAINYIGGLWLIAIGGQAAYDYVKGKAQKDGEG